MTQMLKQDLYTGKKGKPLAVYLAWARDHDTASREGNAIAKVLEKPRSKLDDPLLRVIPYPTDLNATAVVSNPKHKKVFQDVAAFVNDNLIANKELMPWQNRAR